MQARQESNTIESLAALRNAVWLSKFEWDTDGHTAEEA